MSGTHAAWWGALKAALLPGSRRRNLPAGAPPLSGQGQFGLPPLPPRPDPWDTAKLELDRLMAQFTDLERQLKDAARRDGLDHDGPMVPTLHALYLCMATLREMTATLTQIPRHYVGQILSAIAASHAAAAAETQRFRAELEHIEATAIYRIAGSIAKSADQALARRVRVFDRNSAIAAAVILLVTGCGCYWWGSSRAHDTVQQSEADPRATDSRPEDQQSADRLNYNNIERALAQCASQQETEDGHRVCNLRLSIEPIPQLEGAAENQPASTFKPVPVPPLQPTPRPSRTEQQPTGLYGFPPGWPKSIGHFGP